MRLLPRELSLDPELHSESLVAAAARALRQRRYSEAFAMADRRCRIATADASHFLLRAGALRRMGEDKLAHDDLCRALEIDPENLTANRSLLAEGSPEERGFAAAVLLRCDKRWAVLAEALRALGDSELQAVGALELCGRKVAGWLAWRGHGPLALRLEQPGASEVTVVEPDKSHPLAAIWGSAASLSLAWPVETEYLEIRPQAEPFLISGSTILGPARRCVPDRASRTTGAAARGRPAGVAVIVPVHGDYEATRLCLETLLADDEGEIPRKIIVVDDHAPDRRIAGMLRDLAGTNAISLICNERNLGFARTINRGLQMLADEDALLLNADTVVPPGFLDRLARAAYAEPNIGTVTPLSNNGEYTSLPVPFRVNALPAVEGIAAIDRAAARVNAGRVIDLPNGVGFCLYLTRACLDRLGFLSEGFGRGYAEDIDFCLRAADAGFRNVCAADVFVGHAGSRSFAGDKRALVMRNLATLERRFPGYRAASAAFLAADPLRPARETIERALIGDLNPVHLLFGGETTERHVVQERSQSLLRRHGQVWTGVAGLAAGRVRLAIRDARGGIPQNLRFDCALDQAETELRKVLRAFPIKRIEFADLAATPSALVKAARRAKIPYDVMVRDAGFVCGWRPGNSGNGRNRPCRGIRSGPTEGTIFGKNARAEPSRSPRDFLRDALTGADKLLAADRHLANSLKPIAGIRRVVVEKFDDENVAFADEGPPPPPPAKCLGVVSSGKNLGTSLQLRELLHKLDDDKWSLVLLGPAFADLSLMAETSAFVTGAVEPEELPSLARGIGISHLLLSERSAASVFHRHARRCRLPIARFDWRQPKTRRRGGDLVLSPAARTGEIARAVRKWLTAAEIRHAKN